MFSFNYRNLTFAFTSVSICVILLLSFMSFVPNFISKQKAYADGLTQENLPPATVGNRQASLFVKVSPPILVSTSTTKQDTFMQLRLFDANNNQTIQHVTYEITVARGIGTTTPSAIVKPILRDFFHAHNGLLTQIGR